MCLITSRFPWHPKGFPIADSTYLLIVSMHWPTWIVIFFFLLSFPASEWPQRPILSQDVHRHSAPADLHAGPLPGFLREEQQVSEKWLLSLRHRHQHVDAAEWRHRSRWRSEAGVRSSGQLRRYSLVPLLRVCKPVLMGATRDIEMLCQVTAAICTLLNSDGVALKCHWLLVF